MHPSPPPPIGVCASCTDRDGITPVGSRRDRLRGVTDPRVVAKQVDSAVPGFTNKHAAWSMRRNANHRSFLRRGKAAASGRRTEIVHVACQNHGRTACDAELGLHVDEAARNKLHRSVAGFKAAFVERPGRVESRPYVWRSVETVTLPCP
jgi:hypothetical protein